MVQLTGVAPNTLVAGCGGVDIHGSRWLGFLFAAGAVVILAVCVVHALFVFIGKGFGILPRGNRHASVD